MDTQAFWNVIGNYNHSTWVWQCIFLALIIISLILAFFKKMIWLPKTALGIGNMFIGVVFFLVYGTEPIQTYFAAPLYLVTGFLFIYEAIEHRHSQFNKPAAVQWILLSLVIVYPLVSFLLGHSFPQLVVYIMPCPIISLSIVIYSCYDHKNKLLLLLMAIWGLTGIKAFFANALEDIILLICGLFCLWLLVKEFNNRKSNTVIISSEFPAPVDDIWSRLQLLSTLQYIAFPYATFKPLEKSEPVWKEGETSNFLLKLFGVIPLGVHTIEIIRFNKGKLEIYTNEHNKSVPVWNHRIYLKEINKNLSLYTDEVEMNAGWKTSMVLIWSKMFYRHRQRKWVRLLQSRK